MKNIYIHVGMQKTGTTFLQKRVFPHTEGLYDACSENEAFLDLIDDIVDTHPAFFDCEKTRKEIDTFLASIAQDKILISRERLFGMMLSEYRDNFYNTETLKRLFPQAKIIMVIRRQDDLLESRYRQSLHAYHHQTINAFLNYRNNSFGEASNRPGMPNLDVRHLDLYKYVRNYVRLFGRENVAVFPFELFKRNQREFLDRLFAFMEVAPFYPEADLFANRSYSLLSCHIALLLNRFVRIEGDGSRLLQFIPNQPFTSYLNGNASKSRFHKALAQINRRLSLRYWLQDGLDKLFYVKGDLINREKRAMIMALHKESNQKLDEEFELGLKQYGYY